MEERQDLISRQAAIDGKISIQRTNGVEMYSDEAVPVEYLKALPSAQPDGISLEWIDKHLEWLDNCDNDFAQLAKVGIKAMVEIWKKDKI